VTATKYDCVRRVGRKLGFKEVEENEDWTLFWTDTSVSVDRVNQMKRWQVNKDNLFMWSNPNSKFKFILT
jgi:predicted hydrocarbon binding protein